MNNEQLNSNLHGELKYLKHISGISEFLLQGKNFIELAAFSKMEIFTKKLKADNKIFYSKNNNTNVLHEIISLFEKKINLSDQKMTKEYGVLAKISYSVLFSEQKIKNQKKIGTNNTIPLHIIPIIIVLSVDNAGLKEEDTLAEWKKKVIANKPFVKFLIKESPFVSQELLDYGEENINENILPLLTGSELDQYQNKIKNMFDNQESFVFPLLNKKDDEIKDFEYIEYHPLRSTNEDTIKCFFQYMDDEIAEIEKNKQPLLNNYNIKIKKDIYMIDFSKSLDVLYQRYQDITSNQNIKYNAQSIYSTFFQKNNNVFIKNQDSIFFDSTNHYGSFNLNILPNNEMISLALNQRIVLNTTSTNVFKEGDVLAVNGPPGTGKTTVLQSIIANMVAENTIDFLNGHEDNQFVWNQKENIKIPKLLNIGCSFTQQAVKNILNSLNFDPPKFDNNEVNLIWNKRWITDENGDEFKYVLDSSKLYDNIFTYTYNNVIRLQKEYDNKINLLNKSNTNNETFLKNEILKLKKIIDNFELHLFKDMFFLNDENKYVMKKHFLLTFEDIKHKYQEKLLNKKFHNINIENISNEIIAQDIQIQNLQTLLKNLYNKCFIVDLDLLSNFISTDLLNELHALNDLYTIIQKEDFEQNINTYNNEIQNNKKLREKKLNSIRDTQEEIENIEKSLFHKLKMMLYGRNITIKKLKENIDNLDNEIINISENDINIQENLDKCLIKKDDLAKLYAEKSKSLPAKVIIMIGSLSNSQKDLISIDNLYKDECDELSLGEKNKNKIIDNIEKGFNSDYFQEFYYAQNDINELKNMVRIPNINLLNVFDKLNLILDNTIRYKCFHLSMRLKEQYFLYITKNIYNLKDNQYNEAFEKKKDIHKFKNTKLYELNYLSLIFPLIISTLHSLNKILKIYKDKSLRSEPNLIDNVIVDEAGQISIEIGYIAAWNAKRLLCVGDTDQIKPVFSVGKALDYYISKSHKRINPNLEIEKYGTDQDNLGGVNSSLNSLMSIAQKLTKYYQYEKLNLSRGLYLVEHRRCPDEIIDYCNEVVYKGILIPKKGNFSNIIKSENSYLNKEIIKPWKFNIVDGTIIDNKNENEANAILEYLENLIHHSNGLYSWDNIGKDLAILTPFRNQANFMLEFINKHINNQFIRGNNRLQKHKNEDVNDLIIGTVHALQGAEKKIILFSLVSEELTPSSMIIKDKSILNVAFSRSKLNIELFGSNKVFNSDLEEMKLIRNYCN